MIERYKQSLLIIHSQIDHDGAHHGRERYRYQPVRPGHLFLHVAPRWGAGLQRADARGPCRRAGAVSRLLCPRRFRPTGICATSTTRMGALASTWHGYVRDGKPVLPIQEDETALVIWALGEYFDLYRRIEETAPFYRGLVTRPADFLLSHVDQSTGLPLPSYDLWEERWGVHTFTVAAVIAGLRAASRLSTEFGETERASRYLAAAERMLEGARAVLWNEEKQRFARMATPGPSGYTLDMTADASLFGLVLLGALPADDPQAVSTLQQVENRLWVRTDVGGVARYENDYYHQVENKDTARVPGNPWFICTMWLARYRLRQARTPEDSPRARSSSSGPPSAPCRRARWPSSCIPTPASHSRSRRSPGVTRSTCERCRSTSSDSPARTSAQPAARPCVRGFRSEGRRAWAARTRSPRHIRQGPGRRDRAPPARTHPGSRPVRRRLPRP